MSTRKERCTCWSWVLFFIVAVMLFSLPGTGGADSSPVERIAGEDRYHTSAEVALEAYESAEAVVVARGDEAGGFADGLSAGVLSSIVDGPILLTRPGSLPGVINSAVDELEASRAYILGGEAAVYPEVETGLEEKGLEVERLAGKNRMETAGEIVKEAQWQGDLEDHAYVVNGFAPADSLVSGPAAFEESAAILQVRENELPQVTRDVLQELGINRVYVVGGTAVVSEEVEDELSEIASVERLAGADRFDTSVKVAESRFPASQDYSIVGGYSYADAIGAAVFGNPVLYVQETTPLPAVVDEYLDNVLTFDSSLRIFGGPAVISETVADAVDDKIDPKYVYVRNQEELFEALEEEVFRIKFADNITVDREDLEIDYGAELHLEGYALELSHVDALLSGDNVLVRNGVAKGPEFHPDEELKVTGSGVELSDLDLEVSVIDEDAEGLKITEGSEIIADHYFHSDVTIKDSIFATEGPVIHHDQARVENSELGSHVYLNIRGDVTLQNLEFAGEEDDSVIIVGNENNQVEATLEGALVTGEQAGISVRHDSVLHTRGDIHLKEDKWLEVVGEGEVRGPAAITGAGEMYAQGGDTPEDKLNLRELNLEAETYVDEGPHGVWQEGNVALRQVTLIEDLTVGEESKLFLREEIDNRKGTTIKLHNQAEIEIHPEAELTNDIRDQVAQEILLRETEIVLDLYFEEFVGWRFGEPYFPFTWTGDIWMEMEEDIEGVIVVEIEDVLEEEVDTGDFNLEKGIYLSEMVNTEFTMQELSGAGGIEVSMRPKYTPVFLEEETPANALKSEVRALNAAGTYQILLAEDRVNLEP